MSRWALSMQGCDLVVWTCREGEEDTIKAWLEEHGFPKFAGVNTYEGSVRCTPTHISTTVLRVGTGGNPLTDGCARKFFLACPV